MNCDPCCSVSSTRADSMNGTSWMGPPSVPVPTAVPPASFSGRTRCSAPPPGRNWTIDLFIIVTLLGIGLPSLISSYVNDYFGHNAFYTEQDANGRSLRYLYSLHPGREFYQLNETGVYEPIWKYNMNPIKGYNPKMFFNGQSNQKVVDQSNKLSMFQQNYSMYDLSTPSNVEQVVQPCLFRYKIVL